MKKPTEQSLTKLADAAFRQAALTVIKCAEESGTPISTVRLIVLAGS